MQNLPFKYLQIRLYFDKSCIDEINNGAVADMRLFIL